MCSGYCNSSTNLCGSCANVLKIRRKKRIICKEYGDILINTMSGPLKCARCIDDSQK